VASVPSLIPLDIEDRTVRDRVRNALRAAIIAAGTGDLVSYVEADRVFHLAVLGCSGNTHLIDAVSRLRAQTRRHIAHIRAEWR
jgi:DNA-binding GntR family transcriptional regulator